MQWELSILDWMQETLRGPLLDVAMPWITMLGEAGVVWVVLTVALLCTKRYRRVGLSCACALLLDLLVCNILIKPLVARVRPFDCNPLAPDLLVTAPEDFSFPSGHTAASFAATSALYASGSRLWMPAAGLSLLIAFSRLYLYVHYPTDVLAGLVLGTVLGFVGRALFLRLERAWKLWKYRRMLQGGKHEE